MKKITKYIVATYNRADVLVNKEPMTLPELIKYFGYTLEVGNSWDKKVNRNPKTIASFITNYNRAVNAKYASCYNRPYASLIEIIKCDTESIINQ